jgi:hypothetical protein
MGFSGVSSWFKRDSFPTNTRKMPYDIYAEYVFASTMVRSCFLRRLQLDDQLQSRVSLVVRPFHQYLASMSTYTAAGNLDHQDSSTALFSTMSPLAMSATSTKAASNSFSTRARMWAADREAWMYLTTFASTPGLQQRRNMPSHIWTNDDPQARNSGGFRRARAWKLTRVSPRTLNSTQLLLCSLIVLFAEWRASPMPRPPPSI